MGKLAAPTEKLQRPAERPSKAWLWAAGSDAALPRTNHGSYVGGVDEGPLVFQVF